jgi:hypothetical protein
VCALCDRLILLLVLALLRLRFGNGLRPQSCKVCGRRDKFDFHIADDVWKAVIPPTFQNRVVCLSCFDNFAYEKGIDYASALQSLCFAGDKACFDFRVELAVNTTELETKEEIRHEKIDEMD